MKVIHTQTKIRMKEAESKRVNSLMLIWFYDDSKHVKSTLSYVDVIRLFPNGEFD